MNQNTKKLVSISFGIFLLTTLNAHAGYEPRSFWTKFFCGDLITSDKTRLNRYDDHIQTLKASSQSYYDMLRWELVQEQTLEQYLWALHDAIKAGTRLARNATSFDKVTVFRGRWSQLRRYAMPFADFEEGAKQVIRKRTSQEGFDPSRIEAQVAEYKALLELTQNRSLDEMAIIKPVRVIVNELAFQNEFKSIQNSIGFKIRFENIIKRTDTHSDYAGVIRNISIEALEDENGIRNASQRWFNEIQSAFGSAQKRGDKEKLLLSALQGLNYESFKFMYLGRLTSRSNELDLNVFSSFLDSLTTQIRNYELNRTPEYWEVIRIAEGFEKGLDGFWAYEPYLSSRYRERLQALVKELKRRGL